MTFLQPLRRRQFRRLVLGRLLAQLGEWVLLAALVGWVYEHNRSTAAVAGLMLVRMAPPILGAGVAAAIVDRLPRGRLLVTVELARAAAVAAALAAVTGRSPAVVYACVGIASIVGAVGAVAVRALVPTLVESRQLPAANALMGVSMEVAMGTGALAAGIVVSAAAASAALAIVVAASLVAARLYSGLATTTVASAHAGRGALGAGFRYLRRQRVVLVALASFALATIATGLTNATLPRLLSDDLGLGAGGYGFGLAALACGLALGQIGIGFVSVGRIAARWIGWSLLGMAAALGGLGVTGSVTLAVTLLALVGFADGTSETVFETVVQRECDPAHLGCVFGLGSSLMRTSMIGAVALAPLLNAVVSARTVVAIGAVSLGLAAAATLAWTRPASAVAPLPEVS